MSGFGSVTPVGARTAFMNGAAKLLTEAALVGLVAAELAVAAHVAAGSAHAHVGRVAVADVAQAPQRSGVDARESARSEPVPRAVAELDLDRAAVHEVRLLLALVRVPRRRVSGRDHDRVDAERLHAE